MKHKLLMGAGFFALLAVLGIGSSLLQKRAAVEAAVVEAPQFEVDPLWPKPLPNHSIQGMSVGVSVDAQDHIWIVHRTNTFEPMEIYATAKPAAAECCVPAPPVLEFDEEGNLIGHWGGPGEGYDWPDSNHGITVDYKGNVWIGGNSRGPDRNAYHDNMVLKFTQGGKFLMQIGHPGKSQGSNDVDNLKGPAKMFVDKATDELYVADGYGNHRVIVFDADTGAFNRMWGAFGNAPVDLYNCPPPSLNSVPSGEGPQQFSIAHAIRVSEDGLVYLADRENRRVQVFTIEGKFVKQLVKGEIPFARDLAFSADPEQQFLYVGGGPELVVVDRKTLEIVESIKGAGVLGGGHQMATDSKGNIYTAQTNRGLQKLAFKGMSAASR